jgi:hypothetical protein
MTHFKIHGMSVIFRTDKNITTDTYVRMNGFKKANYRRVVKVYKRTPKSDTFPIDAMGVIEI